MADGYFSRLIAHLAWADDRVLAALRSATNPDPSCREVFAHLLAAEHVWLARLNGETPAHPVWPDLSLEQCAAGRAAVERHMLALSTYLGHAHVEDTYWYLEATPALMSDIATAGETLHVGGEP